MDDVESLSWRQNVVLISSNEVACREVDTDDIDLSTVHRPRFADTKLLTGLPHQLREVTRVYSQHIIN